MTDKSTLTQAIRNGVTQTLKMVNTAIPGYFLNFDPSTQLADIQVSIERVDVNGISQKWSPIISCPVHFPGCDFVLEYQIDTGAEGLVIFSQRCIDAWVDQGGVSPQSRIQFHDANDAIFIPGVRSQPNKITGFSNNGIKLRNKAGDKFVWLKNDGTAAITVDTLNIDGDIIHNGNTTQTGDISQTGNNDVTGTISASISVNSPSFGAISGGQSNAVLDEATINGITFTAHTHSQANDSAGNTEQDTGVPK